MGTIEDLDALLCDILGNDHTYYQPPENLKIQYPCIIYHFNGHYVRHANDHDYHRRREYEILYISRTPDDDVVDRLADLPYCHLSQTYTAENLYHYSYTLYY